jgi:hypothetical protein
MHATSADDCVPFADDLVLDPKLCYIIVPHTIQPKVENNFLLRLFSESEVRMSAQCFCFARVL